MVEFTKSGAQILLLVERSARMGIEVAIGAFRLAKRPVDVDRKGSLAC